MEHDFNVWGILSVPVGVVLCFGPALLVWLKLELKGEPPEEPVARTPETPRR